MSSNDLVWQKSSFSIGAGDCLEFTDYGDGTIGLRDSKDPTGPVLRLNRRQVDDFIKGGLDGEVPR